MSTGTPADSNSATDAPVMGAGPTPAQKHEPVVAQQPGGYETAAASAVATREVELLANTVAEKALEKIVKWVRWPLLLAAAFATYMGYNVWSDVNKRIDTFQKDADKKLADIDKNANEKLDKELTKVLDARKVELTELTHQLRKESAAAVVGAERARVASEESLKKIEDGAKEAIARVDRQAGATIAGLEAELQKVTEHGKLVLHAMARIEVSVSERNQQIIKNESGKPGGGLVSQDAFKLVSVTAAVEEIDEAKPVKVAVLATGVSEFAPTPNGETLEGRLVEGKSFVSGETIEDGNGYGTRLASVVAAMVPAAQIVPVKVLSDSGAGSDSTILAGLNYAGSVGAKVVVLAVGSSGPPSRAYTAAFKKLRANGVLVFVAAGQDGGAVGRPANSPHAIAVTATTLRDTLLPSANMGPEIALAAPGEDILTVGPDGTYVSLRGTGLATPIAASVAALVLSARPDLTPDDVESILKQSAKRLDLGSNEIGAGRVDALAAVRLAKSYKPPQK